MMHARAKFGNPTSNDMRDMLRTIILKTKSEVEVKVTVTRKWYATLCHPNIHPHTKFGISALNNIGDTHRTRSGSDGRTGGQCDYYIPPKVPLGV